MAVSLPEDLLRLILDVIQDDKDIQSLLALCLVNRDFAFITQPYIYSNVNRYDKGRAGPVKFMRLILTLARKAHLRLLVRKIDPLPNLYRARWCMSGLLRLIGRNLRGMPNLTVLDYNATAPVVRCGPIRRLPGRLSSLSIFAYLDDDTFHLLNEQSELRRLSVLDIGPESNTRAVTPILDRLLTSATLPRLTDLTAPFEMAIRLLPGRPVRSLSIPSALEDVSPMDLANAIAASDGPLRALHLHMYAFGTLKDTLPSILQATRQLMALSLDFIEIRNQHTLEQLSTETGLSLFNLVPDLRRLFLRFTFRIALLQEDHQPFVVELQAICPAIEEVALSSMLRGESITYGRVPDGIGGTRWERVSVVVKNEAAFYAAHA